MSEEKRQRFWVELLEVIEGKMKILESKLEKLESFNKGDSEND